MYGNGTDHKKGKISPSEQQTNMNSNMPNLLHKRSSGASNRTNFLDTLSQYRFQKGMTLLDDPQIISPHSNGNGAINDIDIDSNCEGRFLLIGSSDCTVSIFDLSRYGSQHFMNQCSGLSNVNVNMNVHNVHGELLSNDDETRSSRAAASIGESRNRARRKHIARSVRQRGRAGTTSTNNNNINNNRVPLGHEYSVSSVQWYPVDTGMFISLDKGGNVYVWDTNAFEVVDTFNVGHHDGREIRCAAMPVKVNSKHMLIACGCANDRTIRLCDITSGSFSHELVGHGADGVNSLAWSPTNEFILASASNDHTVRLWDIRKSGSAACVAILDNQCDNSDNNRNHRNHECFGAIGLGYSGMNYKMKKHFELTDKNAKRRRYMINTTGTSTFVGQNNFSRIEAPSCESHEGAVTAVQFSPNGQHLVSAGVDARLRLWDLRLSSGALLPTFFLGADGNRFDRRSFSAKRKIALEVTQTGSSRTTTIWYGNEFGELLGYQLHGEGGEPKVVLRGHLDRINCLAFHSHNHRIFTGSQDGMILGWGCPPTVGSSDTYTYGAVSGMSVAKEDVDCWS